MINDSRPEPLALAVAIRRHRACTSFWALAAATSSLGSGTALAQQAQTTPPQQTVQADETSGLAEVVVTARYRTENLQETPIAITALTTADIEERQLINVNDLGSVVPNAYFRTPVSNYGPTETIGLRGITQVDFSYTFEPAVAVYVDDVYHATETGGSLDLTDLERVEVLNGPQGTLFGKNALGGAIRLITVRPKGDDTGTFEAIYGQHNRLDLKGVSDFSLIPNQLFVRVIGLSSTQEGFGNDLDFACEMAARGTPQDSGSLPETVSPTQGNGCSIRGLGGHDHHAGKIELRYVPNDDLEFNLDANYTKQADEPYPQALLTPYGNASTDLFNYLYSTSVLAPKYGINYTASAPGHPTPGSTLTVGNINFLSPSPYDNYSTFGDVVTGQQYDATQYLTEWGLPFTADYRITDKMHAKLILAYESYQSNWINDSDLTPFGITQTYYQQEHRQYQAEFRLTGTTFEDRLDWTAGLFYYNARERAYNTTNFDAFAFTGLLGNFVANDYYTDKDKAAYLHAEYKFTDQWSVSGGVRYTDELKSNIFDHVNEIPAESVVVPFPKGLTSVRFDWNGSINFQATKDVLFYGSVATGFRSPGFNPRIFTAGQLQEVPGEKAIQYEIGNKSDFFDHRLRANTAIFYIDYQSHLNNTFGTQCDSPFDLNPVPYQLAGGVCPKGTFFAGSTGLPWFLYTAAPATIRGVEEQLFANPIERLQMNLNFGFNQFRSKTNDPLAVGYTDPSVKMQPEINMSGGIQYGVPLASAGTLTPRIDWIYQSYMTNGPLNLPQVHPDWIVPGYSIFNLRVTFNPEAAKWSLAAGVTNLFNKFYWEQLGPATSVSGPNLIPAVAQVGTPGIPREWTVSFTKRF
jgi:iron complex outermembrane recepter protein